MQLFGSYTSPFVRHCRIALIETGIAAEFIETDNSASDRQSPTKRVPFFRAGELMLTDSASIVRYLREQAGQKFLATVQEHDQYCLVCTSLDACVNIFFLERDGITTEQSSYLQRQQARVTSSLQELAQLSLPDHAPYNDMHLRLACYLAWGVYRNRIALDDYPALGRFLQHINNYEPFARTAPPAL